MMRHCFGIIGQPAQWGQADFQVAPGVRIGHGKDIDGIEQIRPGRHALVALNQGTVVVSVHTENPIH